MLLVWLVVVFLLRKRKWVLEPQDETQDLGFLEVFFTSKRVLRAALARGPGNEFHSRVCQAAVNATKIPS